MAFMSRFSEPDRQICVSQLKHPICKRKVQLQGRRYTVRALSIVSSAQGGPSVLRLRSWDTRRFELSVEVVLQPKKGHEPEA